MSWLKRKDNIMLEKLKPYKKFITALVGVALVAASTFAPGKYDGILAVVISFLTAVGVYEVANEEVTE